MTENDKALVETSRHFMALVATEDSLRNHGYNATAEIIGVVPRLLDRIEALSAENERLREQLSGISGRLNIMREALIHTAGICNPASGFLKNATGVRKKHIENVCNIALAALGDTK